MYSISRRHFLASCGASALAAAYRPKAQILGANEQLRVAVIGFGGRGQALINGIRASKSARLVALCDVDTKVLHGFEPDRTDCFRTQDFRAILDRDDIDAILSATPNHWHALLTVLSCQAGKHVYMEKPISHNMWESRQIVAASRRYDRIVQAGFQNRSDSALIPFFEALHRGDFGAIQHVRGTCYRDRDSIGLLDQPLQIPSTIDYNLWLGPAADQPIYRPKFHYDWHWDFNTGNGDVGNQGPHEWDLMNWALGDPAELPTKITAVGNRFGWNDAGDTPNVLACWGEMNGIPFAFEVVNLKKSATPPQGVGVGVIITTEQGTFAGGRGGGKFTFHDGEVREFRPSPSQKGDATVDHIQNFFMAIANHQRSLQRSEAAIAAKSSSMAHMANISYLLGSPQSEAVTAAAGADAEHVREMLSRLLPVPQRYAESQKRALSPDTWIVGSELTFDNATGQFSGDRAREANQKMTREYREAFLFPAI